MTTWIFQGNPQRFNIDDYLAANRDIRWLVTRYADRISEGDVVYLWRTNRRGKDDAAIVAKAIVGCMDRCRSIATCSVRL